MGRTQGLRVYVGGQELPAVVPSRPYFGYGDRGCPKGTWDYDGKAEQYSLQVTFSVDVLHPIVHPPQIRSDVLTWKLLFLSPCA